MIYDFGLEVEDTLTVKKRDEFNWPGEHLDYSTVVEEINWDSLPVLGNIRKYSLSDDWGLNEHEFFEGIAIYLLAALGGKILWREQFIKFA